MAPMQRKLRKALGAVKDQTSISLAKVASTGAPDLDVALVKATSHEEVPIEEKYVQEILHLTSFSRAYVSACVAGLAKRLGKTHNWIVAIKALMLTHRLVRDGDVSFEQELLLAGRRGMRVLNLSDFRDDSHSNAWDYSAFVRTYALYLDERLDCSIPEKRKQESRSALNERRSEYGDSGSYRGERRSEYGESGSYRGDYGSGRDYEDRRREESQQAPTSRTMKDMPAGELLEKFTVYLSLLDRVLACRPTGSAKTNRLVQIALYPIVRESFQLYSDICDGLAILLDAFFDMELEDSVKAFEIYTRGAKLVDELISFYSVCKTLGVCRTSEYPMVQKISEELLETMDDFLRNRSESSSSRNRRPKSPARRPKSPPRERELGEEEAASYEVNGMKALPAPPTKEPPKPEAKAVDLQKQQQQGSNGDLLNLDEGTISTEEHGDRLALALFQGTESSGGNNNNRKWEAFPSAGEQQANGNGATVQSSNGGGTAGWELALIESESELSKVNGNAMAGGFDRLLLDSMYDQAVDRHRYAVAAPAGSASSVAMPPHPGSSFLALPAPPSSSSAPASSHPFAASQDPFAASAFVPPPSYVQMSDVKQKQQLLVQEQQLWMQYQRDGMQGYNGLMKFPNNPYLAASHHPAYTVPYYGAGSSYY